MSEIRVGIVGLGANTRLRHVPGLLAQDDVKIAAVVNRSRESSERAANEFNIPKIHDSWEQLVNSDEIDAVVIGTWPYMHCEVTLAALAAGKHVLSEARMAMNLDEAQRMYDASQKHSELVTQIVPSPLGFRCGNRLADLITDGFIGELREVVVLAGGSDFADADAALHWRQNADYSGINMLALGIIHEPLTRWISEPTKVFADLHSFTPNRLNAETNEVVPVGTPDSLRVLTHLPSGARGTYHLSGVMHHGPGMQIHLYGSAGTIKYLLNPEDKLFAGKCNDSELKEVEVSQQEAGYWRVEEEFIQAIRGIAPVKLNDFDTGLRYMRFTEMVARSAADGSWHEVAVQ
ncbi:MAG: putative dehydrogenase [Pirellulaceae bacterium]|jgi:predicted dehydrogenase